MRTITALLTLTSFLCAQSKEFRAIQPPTLQLKPGITFLVSGDVYSGPGHVRVKQPQSEHRAQFGEHRPKAIFAPPASPTQAFERCTWLHWGALIPDAATYDAVVAAFRKHGYDMSTQEKPGTFVETMQCPVEKRRFDIVEKKTDNGFEVAFTAWVMPTGMGAQGLLTRYRYTLDRSGRVTSTKAVPYLRGPYLNWQTAMIDFGQKETEAQKKARREFIEKDRQRVRRKKDLIDTIYALNKVRKLPLGR